MAVRRVRFTKGSVASTRRQLRAFQLVLLMKQDVRRKALDTLALKHSDGHFFLLQPFSQRARGGRRGDQR